MAETLISPGVLARENDQSQVTSQPVQAGACIVGPTVLGSVNIPKLVTSYSEYLANFGSTFTSGSDEYTYFTSISAYNYFQNGGTSLIVNRVASGSWTPASSSKIENDVTSTELRPSPYNFTGSAGTTGRFGTAATATAVASTKDGGASTATFDVVRNTAMGRFTSDAAAKNLKTSIQPTPGTLAPVTSINSPYTVALTGGSAGLGATATVVIANNDYDDAGSTVTIAAPGSGYVDAETITIAAGSLGTGMFKLSGITTNIDNSTLTGVLAPATTNTAVFSYGNAGGGTGTLATFDVTTIKAGTLAPVSTQTTGLSGAAIAAGAYGFSETSTAITILDSMTNVSNAFGGTVTLRTDGAGSIINIDVATGASTGYTNVTGTITLLQSEIVAAGITLTGGGSAGTGGSLVITLTNDNINTIVGTVTPTARGGNYAASDTITFAGTAIGLTGGDAVLTIQAGDLDTSPAISFAAAGPLTAGTLQTNSNLLIEPVSIVLNTQGSTTFTIAEDIEIANNATIGSPADAIDINLTDNDLVDDQAFELETLSDGTIMNTGDATGANGTLTGGTSNNIRWEIQGTNTSTGTFSLVIRQGNDTQTAKRVLEIFPNVSLDPKSSNYIERIVGNMTKVFNGAGSTDPFISTVGNYPVSSRYVRVKSVKYKTPDYFDNNGTANPAYATFLPDSGQSGSFGGADGALFSKTGFPAYTQARYYDAIIDDNSQGMTGTEAATYTDAFNLLANKDDYQYNIISAPGLYFASSTWATPMNTLLSNTQGRGDAIAVIDLVNYSGGTVNTAIGQAKDIDNSYAAAYWPWVQLNDPDSRQLVWAVPSAVIPGVYAFNDRTSEAWFAPAGINRGGLSTVVQAQRKLTQSNRDTLYTGKVNPIATFPGRGVVVFGQKTLQSTASALDRINVRRLLIALKSFIVQIADNLVFEQNTAATRNNFLAQVNPYLESVQQRQGLFAFKVQMDAANNGPDVVDRNQMVGAIFIQPTRTAEFIYLDFNILPTGAEFPS